MAVTAAFGEQIDLLEAVPRLQADLAAFDGTDPGAAHRDPPAPDRHRPVLLTVTRRCSRWLMASFRADDLIDFRRHQLSHDTQADLHRRCEQPLTDRGLERFKLGGGDLRQTAGQLGLGQSRPSRSLASAATGSRLYRTPAWTWLTSTCWSSFSTSSAENPRACHRQDPRRRTTPLKIHDYRDNLWSPPTPAIPLNGSTFTG